MKKNVTGGVNRSKEHQDKRGEVYIKLREIAKDDKSLPVMLWEAYQLGRKSK